MTQTSRTEFSRATIRLLQEIEKYDPEIANFLINKYEGFPVSPDLEQRAYDFFISQGVIASAVAANQGSAVITELLYDGLSQPSLIDKYFLESKAGKAVKERKVAIESKLRKTIEKYCNLGRNDILIGNLGSGPGRDVIDVLSHFSPSQCRIRAVHIDKDVLALSKGKRIATLNRLDHQIQFVQADLLKYKTTEQFDIALLVGILCPLEKEICIRYLKIVKKLIKQDGCLIASNASKKMLNEDPFTSYVMESLGNWKLVYKDEYEMKDIFEKAGYIWKGHFVDAYGFHVIGMGSPITY